MTIAWTLNVSVSDLTIRSWTFLPKKNDTFAEIIADGDVENNTQYSPGPFAIIKPSTLILENVTIQYNGTYRFNIFTKGNPSESFVHVSVTGRCHLYNNILYTLLSYFSPPDCAQFSGINKLLYSDWFRQLQ